MTPEQTYAIREICGAILDACAQAGPLGAPGGSIYAALMTHGCTIQQFEGIMGGLVRAGLLRKAGDCYHVTELGRKVVAQ